MINLRFLLAVAIVILTLALVATFLIRPSLADGFGGLGSSGFGQSGYPVGGSSGSSPSLDLSQPSNSQYIPAVIR